METIFFTVIVVFFALLGCANLFEGLRRWLADDGTLEGCTLVIELGDPETAEALLLRATELADFDPRMRPLRLAVLCAADNPARKIALHFCAERGIQVVSRWQELGGERASGSPLPAEGEI